MIAFEVYVNKLKVCTAGLGELDAIISSLMCRFDPDGRPDEPQILFSVSGVGDNKAYQWVHYNLLVGNRVEIRVINAKKTDEPKQLTCPGGSCGA